MSRDLPDRLAPTAATEVAMRTDAERLVLRIVGNPDPRAQCLGFPIDHPYVEHCWSPILGPTSILLLRRVAVLCRPDGTAIICGDELARGIGVGGGMARSSALLKSIDRLRRFQLAEWSTARELDVFDRVRPLTDRELERMPSISRSAHDALTLGRT